MDFVPGPIARLYDGVLKMIGTASGYMGDDDCGATMPVYYTLLTEHLSWILSFSEIPGKFKRKLIFII
jgi:hypothetical protein